MRSFIRHFTCQDPMCISWDMITFAPNHLLSNPKWQIKLPAFCRIKPYQWVINGNMLLHHWIKTYISSASNESAVWQIFDISHLPCDNVVIPCQTCYWQIKLRVWCSIKPYQSLMIGDMLLHHSSKTCISSGPDNAVLTKLWHISYLTCDNLGWDSMVTCGSIIHKHCQPGMILTTKPSASIE